MWRAMLDRLRTFKLADCTDVSPICGSWLSCFRYHPSCVCRGSRAQGWSGISFSFPWLHLGSQFSPRQTLNSWKLRPSTLGVNADGNLVFGFSKYELYCPRCLLTYELIKRKEKKKTLPTKDTHQTFPKFKSTWNSAAGWLQLREGGSSQIQPLN